MSDDELRQRLDAIDAELACIRRDAHNAKAYAWIGMLLLLFLVASFIQIAWHGGI